MRPFKDPDQDLRPVPSPVISDTIYSVVLVAGTAQPITIPAGAVYAVFSFDADVYMKVGAAGVTAALPTVTGANGSERNPTVRKFQLPLPVRTPNATTTGSTASPPSYATTTPAADTTISLVSAAAAKGSIAFYG